MQPRKQGQPHKGWKKSAIKRLRKKLPDMDGTLNDVDQLPIEAWAVPEVKAKDAKET